METGLCGILTIKHTTVLTVYHEICALLLPTKVIIYDKEVSKCLKENMTNRTPKYSDSFLFESTRSKLHHIQVRQDKLTFAYIQTVSQ